MKTILLIAVASACLVPNCLSSQEIETRSKYVKSYILVDPDDNGWYVSRIIPAVARATKAGNYQELALREIYLSKNSTSTTNKLAISYEYGYQFLKANTRLRPSLAAGAIPYVYFSCSKQYIDAIGNVRYPRTRSEFGIDFAIVPRLVVGLTPRWFLDLNAIVAFLHVSTASYTHDDPGLPASLQKYSDFEAHLPYYNALLVRLGAGVKL
jgi:hypothetical protein